MLRNYKNKNLINLKSLVDLKEAWEQYYPKRSEGGLLALSGFEHQFYITLLKIVRRWKEVSKEERLETESAQRVLAEAISDIVESDETITITQVKRTLSEANLRDALQELWEIFEIAYNKFEKLSDNLYFTISGKIEQDINYEQIIKGWKTKTEGYPKDILESFKRAGRINVEAIPNPKDILAEEIQDLSRNEDSKTTIARWLGYFLQLGSGLTPESISALIWKEITHDSSLHSFKLTLSRLLSISHTRISSIRDTLGHSLTLNREHLISKLDNAVSEYPVTFLSGASGSGKSALCKTSIQNIFNHKFDCFFLKPADIFDFSESSEVKANKDLRRLDELLIVQITLKPALVVIDDLSDANQQQLECTFNLLNKIVHRENNHNIRFIITTHTNLKEEIKDKISANLSKNTLYKTINIPQIPIPEILESKEIPDRIYNLVTRSKEFGPALNLKLIDGLFRSFEEDSADIPIFCNDLDLLDWFWNRHVQSYASFANSKILTDISFKLADQFTPNISFSSLDSVDTQTIQELTRKDCIRISDSKIALTHRFVGDCARFQYLKNNSRSIETQKIIEWLANPFWIQPVRWFSMSLTEDSEAWQEFFHEALSNHKAKLFLDLLIDGAILNKKSGIIFQDCPKDKIAFLVAKLFARILEIGTTPYLELCDFKDSISLQMRISIQKDLAGIPKSDLWIPTWQAILALDPTTVVEESRIIFKAAEAWLAWGNDDLNFPLRKEVSEFTLNLLYRILLPEPEPEGRKLTTQELEEIFEQRERGVLPKNEPDRKRFILLGEYERNAFACLVFSIRIIPEYSGWLLKALVGRESVAANRLETTKESNLLSRPGVGILSPPNPQGPFANVNPSLRKFLLSDNGIYLNYIVKTNTELGAEILLALTISPPEYVYKYDYSYRLNRAYGTEGSNDIDIPTFRYPPLVSLLESNEELGIRVITTLSNIAINSWLEFERNHNYSTDDKNGEDDQEQITSDTVMKADSDGITLLIGNQRKYFRGRRQSLYWHRNHIFCPNIVACFLMTLEGWLYSRPTKKQLDKTITLIFEHAETVDVVGALISLAKCCPPLLLDSLLPIISSLQLQIWLEYESTDFSKIDQGLSCNPLALLKISESEHRCLQIFHNLDYRNIPIEQAIHQFWIKQMIPEERIYYILDDWDKNQMNRIPRSNQYRAQYFRQILTPENWEKFELDDENYAFNFIGRLPENPEVAERAKLAQKKLDGLQLLFECKSIIKKEKIKSQEFHNELIGLILEDDKFDDLTKGLEQKEYLNIFWAAIATILEPPLSTSISEFEEFVSDLAESLTSIYCSIDRSERCQHDELDAHAFIAHVAPKLISQLENEKEVRKATLRCFLNIRNKNTSTFIRSWIQEKGFHDQILQDLITYAPSVARLLSLTYIYCESIHIQNNLRPDGSYLYPRPEEINISSCCQETTIIEDLWLRLECDFINRNFLNLSIIDASSWIPEQLTHSVHNFPEWIQRRFTKNNIDWGFLVAAVMPILETEKEYSKDTVKLLCQQITFALINNRHETYIECKSEEESNHLRFSRTSLIIYETESQLLDAIIRAKSASLYGQVNLIIDVLKSFDLLDCILLDHILKTVLNDLIYTDNQSQNSSNFRESIAFLVGNYIIWHREQSSYPEKILGKTFDIFDLWNELLRFITYKSRDEDETDQLLISFFEAFETQLLSFGIKGALYQAAKVKGYKKFRRKIFELVTTDNKLLPVVRDGESETLTQVIAELWESDRTWISRKDTRSQSLKKLVGHLQEIDAIGAKHLSDQITNSLSGS